MQGKQKSGRRTAGTGQVQRGQALAGRVRQSGTGRRGGSGRAGAERGHLILTRAQPKQPRGSSPRGMHAHVELYRMLTLRIMLLAAAAGLAALEAAAPAGSPKQDQKRRVSSAAALTTVVPSGLWARCSTREVWPVSSATFAMEGYFQRQSWFWLQQGKGRDRGRGGEAG